MAHTASRMLVIDDEEHVLFALHSYFSSLGYAVDTAATLDQGLERLAGTAYELVISDLRLGPQGSEGLHILSESHARSPSTRVILLTAFGTPEVEQEAQRRGADAFLHKPLPLAEIAQVAFGLLGAGRDRPEDPQENRP